MMRNMLYLCGLPPTNTCPSSNHEKNTRLAHIVGHAATRLTCRQDHFKKESLRNRHIREEPKETELNIM